MGELPLTFPALSHYVPAAFLGIRRLPRGNAGHWADRAGVGAGERTLDGEGESNGEEARGWCDRSAMDRDGPGRLRLLPVQGEMFATDQWHAGGGGRLAGFVPRAGNRRPGFPSWARDGRWRRGFGVGRTERGGRRGERPAFWLADR